MAAVSAWLVAARARAPQRPVPSPPPPPFIDHAALSRERQRRSAHARELHALLGKHFASVFEIRTCANSSRSGSAGGSSSSSDNAAAASSGGPTSRSTAAAAAAAGGTQPSRDDPHDPHAASSMLPHDHATDPGNPGHTGLCLVRFVPAGNATGQRQQQQRPRQHQQQQQQGHDQHAGRWRLVRRYVWDEGALVAAGQLARVHALWRGEALAYLAHVDALQSFLSEPAAGMPPFGCDAMAIHVAVALGPLDSFMAVAQGVPLEASTGSSGRSRSSSSGGRSDGSTFVSFNVAELDKQLGQMLKAPGGCSAAAAAVATVGQTQQPSKSVANGWDVLALPSACRGASSGPPSGCLHAFTREGARRALAPPTPSQPSSDPVDQPSYSLPPTPSAAVAAAPPPTAAAAVASCPNQALLSRNGLYPAAALPFSLKLVMMGRQGALRLHTTPGPQAPPRTAPPRAVDALQTPDLQHLATSLQALAQLAADNPSLRGFGPAHPTTHAQLGLLPQTAAAARGAYPVRSSATAPAPPPAARRRFLVFTTAGDDALSSWRRWRGKPGERAYDLVVAYTGSVEDPDDPSLRGADLLYRVPPGGSKFQALYRLHAARPGLLQRYEAVAVWDDCVQASPSRLNELLGAVGRLRLWAAQPLVMTPSRVARSVDSGSGSGAGGGGAGGGKRRGHPELAYVSLIEDTAPLFEGRQLVRVLDSPLFTGELSAVGMDKTYMHVLGPQHRDKYAVLHLLKVTSPVDKPGTKPTQRDGISELLSMLDDDIDGSHRQKHHSKSNKRGRPEDEGVGDDSSEGDDFEEAARRWACFRQRYDVPDMRRMVYSTVRRGAKLPPPPPPQAQEWPAGDASAAMEQAEAAVHLDSRLGDDGSGDV